MDKLQQDHGYDEAKVKFEVAVWIDNIAQELSNRAHMRMGEYQNR